MAAVKFTHQQIERFNDRIKNCIDDSSCRAIFKAFLEKLKKPILLKALILWEAANSTESWDENKMLELIEEVDDFNENPLLSIQECQYKLDYTKGECCRILEKILPTFIKYLQKHHKAASC